MGIFDTFFGPKRSSRLDLPPDQIWMTMDAKFAGIQREAVGRSQSQAVAILLVAHFPDVLARLQPIADGVQGTPARAVAASELAGDWANGMNLDENVLLDIVVAERHPLRSMDERLEQFARELPCRCRFSVHVSLDDPVLKLLAGDSLQQLLSQLGMKENEPIQSGLVSRRIRAAVKTLENYTVGNAAANSAAEWIDKNCPQLRNK